MGRRGPAPKPTALRILEGNPSKRPLPKGEPRPEPGIPACPRGLSLQAKREWRRVTGELRALGLLTRLDRAMLALYCHNWALFLKMQEMIKERGECYKTFGGELKTRPEVSIGYRAERQIMALSYHFGLSPAARSRLETGGDGNPEEDALEALLRQGEAIRHA